MQRVPDIDENGAAVRGWKCVAMESGVPGGSQLDVHAIVVQRNGVITRRGGLGRMMEFRKALAAQNSAEIAHHGQQQNIAISAAAGSLQMCMAKSHNGRVFILIAGQWRGDAVRPQFDHTVRSHRTGKNVTRAFCTNKGINVINRFSFPCLKSTTGYG